MSKSRAGFFGKYIIAKADGTPVNREADYFVLRLDTDKWARHAARAYARCIRQENPELADDLESRCDAHTEESK